MSRSRGRLGSLPLMQCVLVKTASGATGNESGTSLPVFYGEGEYASLATFVLHILKQKYL